MSVIPDDNSDPFLSQKGVADNSYIMSQNGVCQNCEKDIRGKTTCPYCGALQ